MQENSFLPEIGMAPVLERGQETCEEARHGRGACIHAVDDRQGRDTGTRFTKRELREHGSELKLFPGVAGWFASINGYCADQGVKAAHFVISSGLREMIEGSEIAGEFEHVFASGFVYSENDVPVFAVRSVNYTTKTQYLFRINKGILNSWDNEEINSFTPEQDRPQPFSRMIYIGDGETDVPAMKTVNYQGGYTIAVFPPKVAGARRGSSDMDKKKTAERLVVDNRAQFAVEADFVVDGPVYDVVWPTAPASSNASADW